LAGQQTGLNAVLRIRTNVGFLFPSPCGGLTALDMIIDNDPSIERYISVPKDMGGLSCSSFTAGIVEAILDGLSFVSTVTSFTFHAEFARSLHA